MMQEQSYKNGVTVMIIKIDLLSGKGMAVYSPSWRMIPNRPRQASSQMRIIPAMWIS